MDYSAAVRGHHQSTKNFILSQAELELGHPLTEVEKGILFSISSQETIKQRIQKYGFGTIKFMMFLNKRPHFKCDVSPNATPRDGDCLFHAISDGILHNDALKHNGRETKNETWTEVLQSLKFFDDKEDHIMYLRTRFVLGASEYMAGNHGSKQNDKELFEYTDEEWEYIWSTMLEEGAWAVPSIKDKTGKTTKANWAPEILIKYIAHELKCHIIVFDLLLSTVQFISGNHVKDKNVVFDSPILIYSTGGHFQSVHPIDKEFFIKYAVELELENVQPNITPSKFEPASKMDIQSSEIENIKNMKPKDRTTEQKKILERYRKKVQRERESTDQRKGRQEKDRTSKKFKRQNESDENQRFRQEKDKTSKNYKRLNETENEQELRQEKDRTSKKFKRQNESDENQRLRQEKDKTSKKYKRLNETENEQELRQEKDRTSKKFKRQNESDENQRLRQEKDKTSKKHKRLNETENEKKSRQTKMKMQRQNESDEKQKLRQEKDRTSKKFKRLNETENEQKLRQTKMKMQRQNESDEKQKSRQDKDATSKRLRRQNETNEDRMERQQKDKDTKRYVRGNSTDLQRLKKFRESVKYGPIFTCSVCDQDMFKNNVSVLTEEFVQEILAKDEELYKDTLTNLSSVNISTLLGGDIIEENQSYICTTCKKHVKKGNLPPMARSNGLDLLPILDTDLQLTELESNLIARTLIFQKIYHLPKSRMSACKDQLINVPVSSDDVLNTLVQLPRTPGEAGLLEVKLKRKLEYKNTHQQAYVDSKKIYKALDFLKKSGHPEYTFYDDYNVYKRRCLKGQLKATFVDDADVDEVLDKEEYLEKGKEIPDITDNEGSDIEEEEYIKKDVIRKYQFDYDQSVCLVDKNPEAAQYEAKESNQISFAPAEGKVPESILNSKNWDTKAFPMKHPDGQNGLHQERAKKLSNQYYFVQRLRNKDTRFSTDPAYTFAAAAYLEKKQLQRNVNVSYQRGKEIKSSEGLSTYHLDDGFSVFDSISNTPKYWKTAKYEMLAKLDNLGPFHFFFTLSCADQRWDENFSCILRKLGMTIVYKTDSDGSCETLVIDDKRGETIELKEYLDRYVDDSTHELIRRNVFIATRNYNHRVKAFIRDIIMDKGNPMCAQYWSTKVEFQGRGAGHNHGTIWVDVDKLELSHVDQDGKWFNIDSLSKYPGSSSKLRQSVHKVLKEYHISGKILEGREAEECLQMYCKVHKIDTHQADLDNELMEQFLNSFPLFGISSAFKKFQRNEVLAPYEEEAIVNFANKFTTCTLNEAVIASKTESEELKEKAADVVSIVKQCYIHAHTKSCKKYSSECRFHFAKFPMWKTILTRPMKGIDGEEKKVLERKYKDILIKVKDLINDKDIVANILEELPKSEDMTKELYETNRKKRILKLLSLAGLETDEDIKQYEEALKFSTPGYSIILERDLDELYVNSYNPEWARAWNGNSDLQVCLDFFAVITYITEYYTKDDTGLMSKLIEMLKQSNCDTLKEKMILVMNTYISARQMGECEAYYKIFPDMNFKDSNVGTVFVPTNRKELRSKFMIRIDEDTEYNGREKKKIHNKEGWYVEKYDLIDKYTRREKKSLACDALTPSQLFKMYEACYKKADMISDNDEREDDRNKEEDETYFTNTDKFHYVMTVKGGNPMPLPDYIKIENPYPGEPPYMRKRKGPLVLRFHKPKQDVDPAAYFFSEALLYTAFRSEKELEERVAEAAKDGYQELEKEISSVKSQVMEYLESNEEARYMVEEAASKNKEIGELLDAEGEQDILDCEKEEMEMNFDYEHLNPDHLNLEDKKHEKVYKPIKIDALPLLKEKTRSLDFYQRKVVEKGIKFCRDTVKASKTKNPQPSHTVTIVHGGAGSGKSTVINILKQWCQLILQQPGDDQECPYIIVAAPTGTAAAKVRGQTMHSAFGFSFGNEHFSLSDKVRDKKRNLLKYLKIVIIDEISMVKSDQQFQLDKRLREITQKITKMFGGVKIFYFGDIMQLKPCMGRYIFDEPTNADFKVQFHLETHWKHYEVITLEENHRQEDDKEYADMLNRFRIGEQTEEDMKKLETRVRSSDHTDLADAVYISCKNKDVEKLNNKMLSRIKDKARVFEAVNVHPIIKNFQPPIGSKGNVKDTPFLKRLVLKRGARVQLTYNIDTLDCLTNGTCGEVINFVENASGQIESIMIKFDEAHQGEQKRCAEPKLSALFPGCTSIQRVMFQYSLAKRSKNVANTAKVIQFPICLCFAATSHKFQGQTISKPKKAAMDFRSVFQAAQSYVMLSRIQSLSQLYIIGSLPENKFYASQQALEELKRLDSVSINRNPSLWEQPGDEKIKIGILNCHSLMDKINDIKNDRMMLFADVLCFSETWLKQDCSVDELMITGYECHLNSIGVGKGIATYFKSEKGYIENETTRWNLQMTKLNFSDVNIISLYRSQGANSQDIVDCLHQLIDADKPTIVAGDFNLCYVDQRENLIVKYLENLGFSQLVEEATHIQGGHIDHVYSNHSKTVYDVHVMAYSPYYTCQDHDAILVTLQCLS